MSAADVLGMLPEMLSFLAGLGLGVKLRGKAPPSGGRLR